MAYGPTVLSADIVKYWQKETCGKNRFTWLKDYRLSQRGTKKATYDTECSRGR